jgi:hypothetical protein
MIPMNEFFAGFVRKALLAVGAYGAGADVVANVNVDFYVAAVMAGASVAWSFYNEVRAARAKAAVVEA